MVEVVIPTDKKKLKAQIKALEYQIKADTNSKDKKIHREALKKLKEAL